MALSSKRILMKKGDIEKGERSMRSANASCLFRGLSYLVLLVVCSPAGLYLIQVPISFVSFQSILFIEYLVWSLLLLGAPFMFVWLLRNALDKVKPPFSGSSDIKGRDNDTGP